MGKARPVDQSSVLPQATTAGIDNLSEAEEDMRRKMMEVLLRQRTSLHGAAIVTVLFILITVACFPTNASQTGNNTLQQTYLPTVAKETAATWPDVGSWVYQLTNYQNDRLDQIAGSNFALAVVDLARDGSADYFTPAEIAQVQASGKLVLAYFEIGAIENYRPEWPLVPDDLKLGPVAGWPGEQYVKYWDPRWWPIVQGRVDQAIAAGFDGAYLDMVVTYEEIPANAAGTNRDDLARKMVALIAQTSAYAKSMDPIFKIVPQNGPELHVWPGYLPAVDGLGMEELYYLATDDPCHFNWCVVNRENAAIIGSSGKLVLTIDYADRPANISDAYARARAAGFVPYASVVALDVMRVNPGLDP